MNESGCFDFKRPIGAQNDYRTSTYRGHMKVAQRVSEHINHDFSLEHKQYFQTGGNGEWALTESQDQFGWKTMKPFVVGKPVGLGLNFIKTFNETHLQNNPKQVQQFSSVSQKHYQWKSIALQENPPLIHITTENDANKITFTDRCKAGFGKLSNPSATTNNLAYRAYSAEELGSTSKNIITFWNWKNTFEKKHTFCNASNECLMPIREFRSSVKHVPNRGLKSEASANYKHYSNLANFDSCTSNQFIDCIDVPNESKSENMVYGSGMRVQKYLA